jgi:hypothetical protein
LNRRGGNPFISGVEASEQAASKEAQRVPEKKHLTIVKT